MPEVWVTGARGFIGRHVAREMAARGHRVHGIGHGGWLEHERATWGIESWVNSDITAASLDVLAEKHDVPNAVLHLAGGSSVGASVAAPREDFARTVSASAELAEWVRTRSPATRVVAASSAAVYGDAWDRPIPAGATLRPCSPYGAHKAAMEIVLSGHARSFGLQIAVVRLFSVYGPGLEKQLLWELCARLASGQPAVTLGGTGDENRDFVFVSDAAAMLAAAVDFASADCPVFNGGAGKGITVRTLAESVLRFWPAPDRRLSFDGVVRKGDPRYLVADVTGSAAIARGAWVDLDAGVELTVSAARSRLASR